MKVSVIICFLFLAGISSFTQNPYRYQKAVFDSIVIQTDIQYGKADFYDFGSDTSKSPLLLDFYEPYGDTTQKRPLVITLFGGAFLAGHKQWDDMIAWCDSLSHYGYACASIQYRLGFNPLNPESIIRASYRALQDARAAIRFFSENTGTYRIDTGKIFLIGNSAGAITSLLTAFITRESERPPSSYGFGTGSDSDDLGCLDCSGNNFSHPVKLAGIISLWGGVWNIDWIEADEDIPALFIYGTNDDTVPFDTGYAFNTTLSPFVYGSVPIQRRMNQLDIPSEIHAFAGRGHAFYMPSDSNGLFNFPNEDWEPVFTLGHEFLYKVLSDAYTNDVVAAPKIDVSIFPNPAFDILTVYVGIQNSDVDASLFSSSGKQIGNWQLTTGNNAIDIIHNFSPGIYILRLESSHGVSINKVVIGR